MSRNTRLFALIGTMVLVASVFAPAVSTGAAAATAAGNADLDVDVTQEGDDVTVSVTKNDTGVEGANVSVEPVDENATYEDASDYTTDDEGVVDLSAPAENITVAVTAAYDNETANTTVELLNETYAEDGNETDAFGQEVSAYIEQLLSGNATGIGPMVSGFVTENNPGADNRPDHAGPPADRGPDRDDDDGDVNKTDDDKRGPPENRGADRDDDGDVNETDDERGPPENRGPDRDDDEDSDDGDEEDEEDDDHGPPEDRGPDRDDD